MSPYSQGLLGLLDAGQPSPQRRPARQGNYSPFYENEVSGSSYVRGGVGLEALPGSEAFIRPATGNGDNYQEGGYDAAALRDYLAQTGYTFQEDTLPDNGYSRYAIDRDGNTVESTRVTGREDTFGDTMKSAAKLAAIMGTAYLGGTALAGMGGAGAAGLTGVDAAMADLAASGGLTPASMASAGAGSLTAAGAGTSLTKLATDAAGSLSGRAIGGLLGAAAGAANSGDKTQTSQQRLDPRMEAMLYGADGKSGYLGAATDWFNQNKGGNPLMLQGAQMMADHYRSPQYTQGYNAMRDTGLGLLNTPRAGNPFTRGG